MTPTFRSALPTDVPTIARIYGYAVRSSIATFDFAEPPEPYWHDKISSTVLGNHVLVVEDDGVVLGYAYSYSFRPRPGYDRTRETSIYLDPESVGSGLSVQIYSELLSRLRADGIHLVVAVVALPNPASVALHEKFGFEPVGTFREVGHKFDKWIDMKWYQLALEGYSDESSPTPAPQIE